MPQSIWDLTTSIRFLTITNCSQHLGLEAFFSYIRSIEKGLRDMSQNRFCEQGSVLLFNWNCQTDIYGDYDFG